MLDDDGPSYFVLGPCFCCGRLFTFNPYRVPSIPIKNGTVDAEGERQPICETCATIANRNREAAGLPTWNLEGAYDPVVGELP